MIFALLTLLASLSLAFVSGWFSIIGIMSIYAGAAFHALIMGIVLEAGKLVTTSWLYRNWTYSDWKLKVPLIIFTIALMVTTSIGVFGFLSKSHLEQGAGTIDNSAKVERLEQQIAREKSTIADDDKVIAQLDATINSYIGKDRTDKSVAIRRSQDPQRKQLRIDIDASQKRIDTFSDERLKLQSEVRKLQLDVGPIRYIAELIYGADGNVDKNIEAAVRLFTLIIVLTLDPLAIVLLIAANHTLMRQKNEEKKELPPQGPHTQASEFRESSATEQEIGQDNDVHVQISTVGIEAPVSPSSHVQEAAVHVPILPKTMGLLDETTSTASEDNEKIFRVHESVYSPGNESSSLEHSSINNYTNDISALAEKETIQEIDLENKTPILEISGWATQQPPIIRQPQLSRITKEGKTDTAISNATGEAVAAVVPPIQNVQTVQDVTSKITPHFIPQKIQEKSPTVEIDEIKQDALIDDIGQPNDHKYPRTLGWLTEFNRT